MKTSCAIAIALITCVAAPAGAQQPQGKAPEVVVLEPAPGVPLRRPTFRVRVSVQAEGDVTAEVQLAGSRRATPMRRLEDGRSRCAAGR
jgi:hypothetical protein